jgi:transposase-like protein
MRSRKRRSFTPEFKREAVRLVLERGVALSRVARDLESGSNCDWLVGEEGPGV